LEILKKLAAKELFKVTSLNTISVIFKIGIGLVTSKLLAIFVGPSGMALVGNFRNFISSLESIATLGFQNGIVNYIAQSREDNLKLNKIISTVFTSLFMVSLLLSSGLFLFSEYLCVQIFGTNPNFGIVFKCLALALPWYATSIFLLSVINGLGHYKRVIQINIIGNAVGLFVSIIMIIYFKTLGAILSIVISPSLMFFITYFFINREINFFKAIHLNQFDFKIIKKLSSFSLMALVSSVIGPMVFLAVRKYVIHIVGLEQAGYWETITRISSYYLMFITTILSIYFLPKLTVATSNQQTKSIFWSFYRYLLPLFSIGIIILYFLRFYIIKTLFTVEFLPVTGLFFWQLIGDFLKVASLILGYNLLAKKMTVVFIVTELFSLSITYFLSLYLVTIFGVEGVVIAHAFTYLVYLIVLSMVFRKSIF